MKPGELYQYLVEAIDAARSINLQRQRIANEAGTSAFMSNGAFTKEFKTVRVSVGRQMGHSTYIFNNAGVSDLIVCDSYQTACSMDRNSAFFKGPTVLTIGALQTLTEPGCKPLVFRDVYIDRPSVFATSDGYKQFFEQVFIGNQLIMLGE